MTPLLDDFRRWCQEESIGLTVDQDDEEALVCTVSVASESPLTVRLEAPRQTPGPTLLAYTFEPAVPEEVAASEQSRERVASLLERVEATRSSLVDCRLADSAQGSAIEIVVTLHEDGLTRQNFLVALAEIEKVKRIVSWELESMGVAVGMMSELQSRVGGILEEAEALAAEAASDAAPDAPTGRFCQKCGKQATPGKSFCNECGAPLGG